MAEQRLKKPKKYASLKEYITYYMNRQHLSQNELAQTARLNQSHVNKIVNGKVQNVKVDTLVRICLALQLSQKEAIDLMARAERALSPASEQHRFYRDLFEYYTHLDFDSKSLDSWLDRADKKLEQEGLSPFPNSFVDKKSN